MDTIVTQLNMPTKRHRNATDLTKTYRQQTKGELRMSGWVGDGNSTFISVINLTNVYLDIFGSLQYFMLWQVINCL